jgi:hypothetical protein
MLVDSAPREKVDTAVTRGGVSASGAKSERCTTDNGLSQPEHPILRHGAA